jgi:gliding motility-associated-like protein
LRTGKSFAVLQAAFFTPNGDGNDYWNLKGLNGSIYKNAKIFISIDTKAAQTIKPLRVGWDGNYNGNSLPSDDYWYYLKKTVAKAILV